MEQNMNMAPQGNNEDLDLDFTKGLEANDFGDVDKKKAELLSHIEHAKNGIVLANKLGDMARVKDLENKLVGYQLTLADIEIAEKGPQAPTYNVEESFDGAAFDAATRDERTERQAASGN